MRHLRYALLLLSTMTPWAWAQYTDAALGASDWKEIGVSAGSKVILTPHTPGGLVDIAAQLRDAFITGDAATR